MGKSENGYLTAEAAFWLPGVAIFLVLLITLCSYLYQGCFMMQAAYLAAFRGSRTETGAGRESRTEEELTELMQYHQVLSFGETACEIETGALAVTVSLERETPFIGPDGRKLTLQRSQRALYLDPVSYIRGLRFLKGTEESDHDKS